MRFMLFHLMQQFLLLFRWFSGAVQRNASISTKDIAHGILIASFRTKQLNSPESAAEASDT